MKFRYQVTVDHNEFFQTLEEGTGVDSWELYELLSANNSHVENGVWCVYGDAVVYFKDAMGSAYDATVCKAAATIIENVRKASGDQDIWVVK